MNIGERLLFHSVLPTFPRFCVISCAIFADRGGLLQTWHESHSGRESGSDNSFSATQKLLALLARTRLPSTEMNFSGGWRGKPRGAPGLSVFLRSNDCALIRHAIGLDITLTGAAAAQL